MSKEERKKLIQKIGIRVMAAIVFIAAIALLWWNGVFLPKEIEWQEKDFSYEKAQIRLQDRQLQAIIEDEEKNQQTVFKSEWDWCVQDALAYDINRDGKDELVMLVWKHGSYGDHLPIWVKYNDIRLEQHIFIYQWDESRDTKLRPIWMSSAVGYQVDSISKGTQGKLVITDSTGESMVWQWQSFGLKLVGAAKEERVSFLCAGDNLIHTSLLHKEEQGYDSFYERIKPKIEAADFASLNQETIFVEDRGLISDYPRFGTPVEVGDAIAAAGFDIVTLANNHVLDKGLYGIKVTSAFYDKQEGMTYLGINPPGQEEQTPEDAVKIVEKNGIRVALLNYTYGTNGLPSPKEYPYVVERFSDEERVKKQLSYARTNADAVIVFAHWGTEYSTETDEKQQYWSDILLEYGVDVVIGTHPHVLQPYEMRTWEDGHQMLVYYSLGNLISGQTREDCQIGGLAEFTIVKSPQGQVTIEDYTLEKVFM